MRKLKVISCISFALLICFSTAIPVSASNEKAEVNYKLVESVGNSYNETTERYSLSSSEFEKLELELFDDNMDQLLLSKALGDFPSRSTYSYGSFQSSDVIAVAGVLLTAGLPNWGVAISIASIVLRANSPTIYYTRIYTQRRTNGTLYVRNEW